MVAKGVGVTTAIYALLVAFSVGALLFVASDALIPLNVFLLPKMHANDLFATTMLLHPGFTAYYAAQYLIALGASRETAEVKTTALPRARCA